MKNLKKLLIVVGLVCISNLAFSTVIVFHIKGNNLFPKQNQLTFNLKVNSKELIVGPNNGYSPVSLDLKDKDVIIKGITTYLQSEILQDQQTISTLSNLTNTNKIASNHDVNRVIAQFAHSDGRGIYTGSLAYYVDAYTNNLFSKNYRCDQIDIYLTIKKGSERTLRYEINVNNDSQIIVSDELPRVLQQDVNENNNRANQNNSIFSFGYWKNYLAEQVDLLITG